MAQQTSTATPMPIFSWDALQLDPEGMRRIFDRNQNALEGFVPMVEEIFDRVRSEGAKAIVELELKYNRALSPASYHVGNLRIAEAEIARAYEKVGAAGLATIQEYVRGVKLIGDALMEKERQDVSVERLPGFRATYVTVPRQSVGVYCPAGQVPLPIVSGMLAQSAACAGVPRIAVFYPPTDFDAEIIVAGKEAGATEFYRIGGAQAIAAMTYGTEVNAPVEMAVGPGSTITQAGKMVARNRGLFTDAIGGPSEQIVLIERGASLEAIIMAARDILSECEHGETSAGVAVTDCPKVAEQFRSILLQLSAVEPRRAVIEESLCRASAIIVATSPEEMIEIARRYGGEHIGLYMRNPKRYIAAVNSPSVSLNDIDTGAAFMSTGRANYGGTYHCTLPTGPNGRVQAGATTPKMFLKEVEVMEIANESAGLGLQVCLDLAECERLPAHRNAMQTTRILIGEQLAPDENPELQEVLARIKAEYR